jgi:hypothetical protein
MIVKTFMMDLNRKFKNDPSERSSTFVSYPALTFKNPSTLPRDHVYKFHAIFRISNKIIVEFEVSTAVTMKNAVL